MITQLYESPIGVIYLVAEDGCLSGLYFNDAYEQAGNKINKKKYRLIIGNPGNGSDILEQTKTQLDEYFNGIRYTFDLPLLLRGTEFYYSVWIELNKIGYACTSSYGELARNIGNPNASRAVGMANHNNPVSIILPCHRVVAANGALTGYGGELWRKEWLLKHEQKNKR